MKCQHTLDWTVGICGEIFIDQKFMGLFSLLFGAGMILFIERAAAGGRRAVMLNLWRNALLLLISILHFMLWEGDVLMVYAISSVFLIALRKVADKTLIVVGGHGIRSLNWLLAACTVHRGHDWNIPCRNLESR